MARNMLWGFSPESLGIIPVISVIVGGGIAAFTDVWKYKVYNALTFPLCFLGIAYHSFSVQGSGLGFSLVGAGVGFIVLLFLHILGAVGAGDVKLLAGIGAWLGAFNVALVFSIAGLATGLYSIVLLVANSGIRNAVANFLVSAHLMRAQTSALLRYLAPDERVEHVAKQDDRRRRLIPFAAMVAVGLAVVVSWELWLS